MSTETIIGYGDGISTDGEFTGPGEVTVGGGCYNGGFTGA